MKKISLFLLSCLFLASCFSERVPVPLAPVPTTKDTLSKPDLLRERGRSRSRVPFTCCEGSLWKDESSWGNLFRDSRARFRSDLLTIRQVQSIVSFDDPTTSPTPSPAPTAGAAATLAVATPPAASPKEKERNKILGSINEITARIAKVFSNGTMLVIGEKVDYRQRNTIRYITRIRGIIRPEDISEANEISATKLARSEVRISRQVRFSRAKKNRANRRATAKTSVLDRLGHIATQPGQSGDSRSTAAPDERTTRPLAANIN